MAGRRGRFALPPPVPSIGRSCPGPRCAASTDAADPPDVRTHGVRATVGPTPGSGPGALEVPSMSHASGSPQGATGGAAAAPHPYKNKAIALAVAAAVGGFLF